MRCKHDMDREPVNLLIHVWAVIYSKKVFKEIFLKYSMLSFKPRYLSIKMVDKSLGSPFNRLIISNCNEPLK